MAARAVTVNPPEPLYQRLTRRASDMHRTVEAEIVEAGNTSLPEETVELPAAMAKSVAALHLLGDDDLWRAARQRLDGEKATEIEALHRQRQHDGLSLSETQSRPSADLALPRLPQSIEVFSR